MMEGADVESLGPDGGAGTGDGPVVSGLDLT